MSSAAILVQAGPSGPSAPPQSFSSRALSRSGAGEPAPYFSSSPDRAWDSLHLASDPTTITIDEDRDQLAESGSSSPGQLGAGSVLLASAVTLEESTSSRSSLGLRNLGSSSSTALNVVPAAALPPRGRSWLADNIAEQQDEDNELERPPRVWMLGNRSGSCDSVGTESSSLTISSSSSELTLSSATGSSTSLPPVTLLPRIQDPSDTSATSSPASSPILRMMPEPVAAAKKAKKVSSGPSGGGGFGVLKEWLSGSSSSFKKGREKAVKQSNLAPLSVAEIAIPSARSTAPAPATAAPIVKAPVEIISKKMKDRQHPFEDASPPLSPSSLPSNELVPPGGAARSASKRILAPLQTFPFASAFRSSNSAPASPADSARSGPASPVSPTTLFPSGQQQQLQPPVSIPHMAAMTSPISTVDEPKAPPQLSPLQSLHLLSSQKLSLLVRPPTAPHPLFVAGPFNRRGSVSLTSASSPCTPSAGAYGGLIGSTERRFPSSTNPYTPKYGSRRRERVSGLVAELGLRSLMQRLEKGGRASRAEVEALTRLFRAKPVSLLRDQVSGNFIASIGEPPPTETVAPTNISSSPLRAATVAPAAGSGILAFLARPGFKERVVCWQRLDDSYGDIVEVDIETARNLGLAELELSRGIEAMAEAIQERAFERPTSWFNSAKQQPSAAHGGLLLRVQPLQSEERPSSTSPSTPVAAISPPFRQTSPTDQPRLASEDVTPVSELPDLDLTTKMPTSVPSAFLRSPSMLPMLEGEESTFFLEPPAAIWQQQRSNSDPTLPAPTGLLPLRPTTTRLNPLARQSFPHASANRVVAFPDVEGSAIDEGEDEDEEDELPLSCLKHRSSFGCSLPRKLSPAPRVNDGPSSAMLLSPPIISSSLVPSSLSPPAPRERVRFSSEILARDLERGTREAERRACEEERHAREEEVREQREFQRALEVRRQEEAERRKQDRIKAEVGAARRRREEAKIGARTREIPESGHWDEVVPATSSGSSSSACSSSSKPVPLRRSETARTISESTPASRGDGLARPEFEDRRRASMYAGGLGGASRPNLHIQANPATFQERPPSLISTTATSSPQTMSPRSSVSSSTPPRPALYHAKSGLLSTAPSGLQPLSHPHKSPSSTSTATPTMMYRPSPSFARPSPLPRHPSWHSIHAQPPLPGSLPLAVPPLPQPALPTAHLHLAQLTPASSYPQLYVPSSTPQVNLTAVYYGGGQPAYNPYHPQPHPYHAQQAAAAYHYHHQQQQARTISHRTSRQSLLIQPQAQQQAQQQAMAHRRGSSGRRDEV